MPWFAEPIFHDRQSVSSQELVTTDSAIFVNIPGATLTTKDLGQSGNYNLFFTLLISATLNNTTAILRLCVNGIPTSLEGTPLLLKTKDLDISYTFPANATGIQANNVLQVQWSTDKGILSLSEFNILIDGIPDARVI
jgi:hypothetical protein